MMDQFFRPEGQTNTFGFDPMRRELNHIQNHGPQLHLHTQTPPPGLNLHSLYEKLTVRMDD
jgi:hypothetical protein